MTISFDAIWIPGVITAIWLVWAWLCLREPDPYGAGFNSWSVGIAWPGNIVLGTWLIWALLT